MRRLALGLVGLVVVVASVAVGEIFASGDPGKPITVAQALPFIRAVNLQPSDLPGSGPFVGEAGSPPEGAELQGLLHCGHRGKPRSRAVAAERSVLEDRSGDWIGELVGSIVIVMPSDALAKAEIATLQSPSGRACMAHDLRSSALGSGGPDGPVYAISLTSAPVAHMLGQEAVVLRLLARLQRLPLVRPHRGGHRLSEPPAKLVYSVEAIFRVGAADIAFYTLGEHRRFPVATESRLLTLLYDRARAREL
ncbi:MAG TPA: hypothetical protein VK701_05865 [Solirubrobacteraceae bacterium]|nr:hypothetical protein [Solirubrobacteraceae bacterium]